MTQYSSYDRCSFRTKPVVLKIQFCKCTCLPSVDRRSEEPQNVGIYPQPVEIDRRDGCITSIEASNIGWNERADSFAFQFLLSLDFDELGERYCGSCEGNCNIAHCSLIKFNSGCCVDASSVVKRAARIPRRGSRYRNRVKIVTMLMRLVFCSKGSSHDRHHSCLLRFGYRRSRTFSGALAKCKLQGKVGAWSKDANRATAANNTATPISYGKCLHRSTWRCTAEQQCEHYLSYKSDDTTTVTEENISPHTDNSIVLHIRISTGAAQ